MEQKVTDVDINSIYVRNQDQRAYQNQKAIQTEYYAMLAEKLSQKREDGSVLAYDILSADI